MEGDAYFPSQMVFLVLLTFRGKTAMNLKLCLASIGTAFCLLAGTPSSAWAGALENAKAAHDAKNYSEEAKWAKIAAEQGNAVAQRNLGVLYANGQGVRQDYQEAAKWTRKAAEQGNASAQFNLGLLYVNGQGVRQDYREAAKWTRKAAEQGYASAQFNLGVLYEQGQGVRQNKAVAKEWFGKACDNGDQKGCDQYRRLNEKGF